MYPNPRMAGQLGEMANFTEAFNTTTASPPTSTLSEAVGLVACFGASLFFGSYLIPAKKFVPGDGVFFQWVMSSAILNYGVVFNLIIGTPKFEPLAMIGGALWANGNLIGMTVIRCIGVGVGQNIWSLISLMIGWADGRFGLFGVGAIPSIEWLQYLGITIALFRGLLAAFIVPGYAQTLEMAESKDKSITRPRNESTISTALSAAGRRLSLAISANNSIDYRTDSTSRPVDIDRETQELCSDKPKLKNYGGANGQQRAYQNDHHEITDEHDEVTESDTMPIIVRQVEVKGDFLERMPLLRKRFLGVGLALIAGANFGLQFATINVLKRQGHSQEDKDYSFSFYTGTFLASSVYMIIYALVKRNEPYVDRRLVAPAFCSGLIWVLGQTCWLTANEALSQSITFPIMSACPSLVSLTWGFFFFREIRGRVNTMLFVAVVVITVISVLMVGFSM